MRYGTSCKRGAIEAGLLIGGVLIAYFHFVLGFIYPQFLAINWALAFAVAPIPSRLFVLTAVERPRLKKLIFCVITLFASSFVTSLVTVLTGT